MTAVPATGRLAALCIVTFAVFGCGDGVAPEGTITLLPDSAVIAPGGSLAFTLRIGRGVPDVAPTWSTFHPELVSISADGVVTGLAPGIALVDVTVGEYIAQSTVAILGAFDHVELVADTREIEVGKSAGVGATAFDEFGTGIGRVDGWPDIPFPSPDFEWESSDPDVATIAALPGNPQAAVVRGRARGTALLSVRYGGTTDTATVSVITDSLSFVADTIHVELDRGAQFELALLRFGRVVPRDSVTLSLADPLVAGLLEPESQWVMVGKREGTTTVTAEYNGLVASAVVVVSGQPERFVSITSIFGRMCATYDDGRLYCWGGETLDVPSLVPTSARLEEIWSGANHFCGLDFDGKAWCWGDNTHGELGTGDAEFRVTPAPVTGGITFSELSLGTDHTCGVTTGGIAYCWGSNDLGQAGTGAAGPRLLSPMPVAGGLEFSSISAGGTHTCGVTPDAAAYCWGFGGSNGLLNMGLPMEMCATFFGSAECVPAPAQVHRPPGFRTIEAGRDRTCAVMTDGQVICWGYIFGAPEPQGPNGTTVPFELVEVALTSSDKICAISASASVYCWTDWVPRLVGSGIPFLNLDGGRRICSIASDGAWCGVEDVTGAIVELVRVSGQP